MTAISCTLGITFAVVYRSCTDKIALLLPFVNRLHLILEVCPLLLPSSYKERENLSLASNLCQVLTNGNITL